LSRILISANGYESASNYGLYWSIYMSNELRSNGHDVVLIANGTKSEIDTALLTGGYDLFYHSGHGCEYLTTTYEYEDLYWINGTCGEHLHTDTDIGVLPEKKVYLLSCLCGTSLVPYIGGLGGSIAGYITEFSWVAKPPYVPGGAGDIYSKWFFDTANKYMKEIANGSTPQEAYNRTIEAFQAAITYWENSTDVLAPLCVTLLIQDMRALIAYHNRERMAIMTGAEGAPPTALLILGIPLLVGGYLIMKR